MAADGAGGTPGTVVALVQGVSATRVDTGNTLFGDPIWVLGDWAIVLSVVLAIIVGKPFVIAAGTANGHLFTAEAVADGFAAGRSHHTRKSSR